MQPWSSEAWTRKALYPTYPLLKTNSSAAHSGTFIFFSLVCMWFFEERTLAEPFQANLVWKQPEPPRKEAATSCPKRTSGTDHSFRKVWSDKPHIHPRQLLSPFHPPITRFLWEWSNSSSLTTENPSLWSTETQVRVFLFNFPSGRTLLPIYLLGCNGSLNLNQRADPIPPQEQGQGPILTPRTNFSKCTPPDMGRQVRYDLKKKLQREEEGKME